MEVIRGRSKSYRGKHTKHSLISEGNEIGYAISRPTMGEDSTGLSELFIQPEFQGKGYSKLLINDVINSSDKDIMLRANPYKNKNLSKSNLENFYSSIGFKKEDDGRMRFNLYKDQIEKTASKALVPVGQSLDNFQDYKMSDAMKQPLKDKLKRGADGIKSGFKSGAKAVSKSKMKRALIMPGIPLAAAGANYAIHRYDQKKADGKNHTKKQINQKKKSTRYNFIRDAYVPMKKERTYEHVGAGLGTALGYEAGAFAQRRMKGKVDPLRSALLSAGLITVGSMTGAKANNARYKIKSLDELNNAFKSEGDGALDGMVRRYHNTSAANVSGIKENGIKANKAVDPNFNTVTKTMAGLSDDEMKDLTYLARKRKVARGVGARREQIDSINKGRIIDEASAVKESFKNQKTLKVNIPLDKYKELNKVNNPELKGAKNIDDTIKLMRDGTIRSTGNDVLDRKSAKALHEMLGKNTDTIKGDIASEFIKGGDYNEKK